MLIEFSVANYRSFRDQVTLSMLASALRHPELDEKNVFAAPGGIDLLASAAVYGANASGKSNLIAAIKFMRHFVMNSQKSTERTGGISVEPFRLNAETLTKPAFFEIVFIAEGRRYRYGFEVSTERVESEWLYVVPTIREAKLFEREGDAIELGERFRSEGRDLIERTRPNALFLSVVAQFDGPIAQKILKWFRICNTVSGLEDPGLLTYTIEKILSGGDTRDEIVQLVRKLDLGIDGVQILKGPAVTPALPEDMPAEFQQVLQPMLELMKNSEQVRVQTLHRQYDGNGNVIGNDLFVLDEHESEGTQKLFALAGPLVDTLQNGKVLVIDELDARLHPLLTREIVKLFNDPETNPNHAQLIFATQDTNLLDNRLLRRDQIWFVEKDRQGASHLYSLAEFKVRNDATYEKEYVQGRFGAIPFLGGVRQVLEQG